MSAETHLLSCLDRLAFHSVAEQVYASQTDKQPLHNSSKKKWEYVARCFILSLVFLMVVDVIHLLDSVWKQWHIKERVTQTEPMKTSCDVNWPPGPWDGGRPGGMKGRHYSGWCTSDAPAVLWLWILPYACQKKPNVDLLMLHSIINKYVLNVHRCSSLFYLLLIKTVESYLWSHHVWLLLFSPLFGEKSKTHINSTVWARITGLNLTSLPTNPPPY